MTRRNLLTLLASLPFCGWLRPKVVESFISDDDFEIAVRLGLQGDAMNAWMKGRLTKAGIDVNQDWSTRYDDDRAGVVFMQGITT